MDRSTCYGLLHVICTVLLMVVTGCLAKTDYASFDNCDNDYTITNDSKVIVTGEKIGNAGWSSSINRCDLMFRAKGRGERLCFEINKLKFKNRNLELNFFNSLDTTRTGATTTFKLDVPIKVPQEFCSEGRESSLQLNTTLNTASIRDVELEIVVHNMAGNSRVGYMDRDCGTTYDLDKSMISVLNRPSDMTLNLTSPCQLYFRYTGANPNDKLCLRYLRNKENCGYKLRVIDGTPQEFSQAHVYSCENDKPQVWCSDKKAFYLEMLRDDVNANEPSSMFGVEIKDGIKGFPVYVTRPTVIVKGNGDTGDSESRPSTPSSTTHNGEVTFPTPEPSSGFPIWAIIVIAVVAVLIVIAVVICLVEKSKGTRRNEIHMEHI